MTDSTAIKEYKGFTIYETERYDEDSYDELLDEIYGDIEICGLTYPASQALESVDPIAYRCGFSDMQEYYYTADAPEDVTGFDESEEFESSEDCESAIAQFLLNLDEDEFIELEE